LGTVCFPEYFDFPLLESLCQRSTLLSSPSINAVYLP
jgi:hypothetical protein